MNIDLFGNPKMEGSEKENARVETTSFKNATTQFMQGIEGAIMPIDCLRVLPKTKIGGHYKINIKMRNPSVRPLKNGMTFRVHAYMCYNRDAWKYWKAYISQGTNGSNGLVVPCIDGYLSTGDTIDENGKITARNRNDGVTVIDTFTPNSLSNCLGIPWRNYTTSIELTRKETGKSDITTEVFTNNRFCFRPTIIKMADRQISISEADKDSAVLETDEQWKDDDINNPDLINALPFVHCQKIYRKFEMSYDMQNVGGKLNKGWYNELEEPLWITKRTTASDPYVNCINANVEDYAGCGDGASGGNRYSNIANDAINYFGVFSGLEQPDIVYINDANNRFVEGSIGYEYSTVEIPHRVNDVPVISEYPYLNSLKFKQIQPDYLNTGSPYPMLIRDGVEPITEHDLTKVLYKGETTTSSELNALSLGNGKIGNKNDNATKGYDKSELSSTQLGALKEMLGITMQDLRKMTVLTRFKEKMSKVSQLDMYNGIIETSFGVRPEKDTHEPIYIGGFSGNLNTYAQTSTNEDFNGATPSGEVGKGECTIEGDIPEYFAEDHGYLIVMISSDIAQLYPRHLDRNWKNISFQDEYFPEFNQLEPQATKKTEKTLAFKLPNGETKKDNVIYNYTDRYVEYKTRLSNLCGLGQSDKQIWDNYQYLTLKAEFEKGDFNVMANTQHPSMIDNKCLTTTTEPMFDYDVLRIIHTVAPLPYKAKPKEL